MQSDKKNADDLCECLKEPQINILLIYPQFPDTFWSFNPAVSFIGEKAAFSPLGLLTVAALLPEEWSKRLVDEKVERLTDADNGRYLLKE